MGNQFTTNKQRGGQTGDNWNKTGGRRTDTKMLYEVRSPLNAAYAESCRRPQHACSLVAGREVRGPTHGRAQVQQGAKEEEPHARGLQTLAPGTQPTPAESGTGSPATAPHGPARRGVPRSAPQQLGSCPRGLAATYGAVSLPQQLAKAALRHGLALNLDGSTARRYGLGAGLNTLTHAPNPVSRQELGHRRSLRPDRREATTRAGLRSAQEGRDHAQEGAQQHPPNKAGARRHRPTAPPPCRLVAPPRRRAAARVPDSGSGSGPTPTLFTSGGGGGR